MHYNMRVVSGGVLSHHPPEKDMKGRKGCFQGCGQQLFSKDFKSSFPDEPGEGL